MLVDLSHAYDGRTLYWPTSETFRLERVADGVTPGGYYYAANNLFTAEHGGTHIDAPHSFCRRRPTVDQIPLERLFGPAVVVDVGDAIRGERRLSGDYRGFDAMGRRARRDSAGRDCAPSNRLLDAVARRPRYLGTSERGGEAVAKLHFPGLHPDAARWLVANRPIRAIGIDTASIDFGQSTGFESHRVLFEHEIPAFENLTALDRLPPVGAFVIALPMKIAGGSGAPLRAVAIVPATR